MRKMLGQSLNHLALARLHDMLEDRRLPGGACFLRSAFELILQIGR
jgi:hypothetical protein